MKLRRNSSELVGHTFDLLVVGGGIHGACVARDAAMRGLSVALIERSDFGSETSHNSLKLIHGGIRYLQHLDFRRTRQSIKERQFWLRCAPHLVRPLRCVIPAYGHGLRGVAALGVATTLFGLLSTGCNRGLASSQHMPAGGVFTRKTVIRDLPGLKTGGLTGAAYWYDAQMDDADRVLLECVQSAVEEGATVCNYVCANDFIRDHDTIIGVSATDQETGQDFEIRASLTVNTAGPWSNKLVSQAIDKNASSRLVSLSKCMNIVIRDHGAAELPSYAFGVVSDRKSDSVIDKSSRMFFVTPWKGMSIIGTSHVPFDGDPDDAKFTEQDVQEFLDEINSAYPFRLTLENVAYCYGGLTPAEEGLRGDQVRRARHGELIDHGRSHGVDGLLTLIGVKYTTARLVAEKAVDMVFKKMGRTSPPCRTSITLLPGARGDKAARHGIDVTTVDLEEQVGVSSIIEDVRMAARNEMVVTLGDLVFRRSNLVESGKATPELLTVFAAAVKQEFGWSEERVGTELQDVLERCIWIANNGSRVRRNKEKFHIKYQ